MISFIFSGALLHSIKLLMLSLMIFNLIFEMSASPYSRNQRYERDLFWRNNRIPSSKDSDRSSKYLRAPFLKMRSVPPTQLVAPETSNQVLECEAGGSPSPTIHWLKDGKRLLQNDGYKIVFQDDDKVKKNSYSLSLTRSKLYLDCINPKDAGTYTCVASTKYNRLTSDTDIKVVSNELSSEQNDGYNSVSLCLAKKSYGSPGRIYMWTHNRLEIIGSDVQLFCRSSGVPTPVTNWIGPDETPITNGEKHQILDNGDLLVKNLSWDDMGNYICVTKNQHGSDRTTMFLYPALPDKNQS